jgi:methylmalonyl-CoA mutase N-terminal domain/subunit
VRVGIETVAAVLGGAQSIFTCAFDEAFQIPTETSAEIALRTQQIVAHESGVARTVDPLGGSYYTEWLTDRMEEEILKVIKEIEDYGGVTKAIEDGYLQARIAARALERKRAVDQMERLVVGVNIGERENREQDNGEVFRLDPAGVRRVIEKFEKLRDRRSQQEVDRSLSRLSDAAARDDENVMPYLVDCCHAYATVGEMVAALKREWGEFREPIGL